MALNKTILKKVGEKTKDDQRQQKFIMEILDAENKGLGQFKKIYKNRIKEAVVDGEEE